MITISNARRANALEGKLRSVDAKGLNVSRKLSAQIRTAVLQAYSDSIKVKFKKAAVEDFTDTLFKLSSIAVLEGLKTAGKSLKLSFSSEVQRYARKLDIDLGNLEENLRLDAKEMITDSMATLEQRINAELAEVTAAGLSQAEARRTLIQSLERMGVSAKSHSYLDTLIRTHSQLAFNAARWSAMNVDPNVWGFKYVTARDDSVRPSHAKMEGLTRPKEAKIWLRIWPPNGWNCRCQVVEVYDAVSVRYTDSADIKRYKPDPGFSKNVAA